MDARKAPYVLYAKDENEDDLEDWNKKHPQAARPPAAATPAPQYTFISYNDVLQTPQVATPSLAQTSGPTDFSFARQLYPDKNWGSTARLKPAQVVRRPFVHRCTGRMCLAPETRCRQGSTPDLEEPQSNGKGKGKDRKG